MKQTKFKLLKQYSILYRQIYWANGNTSNPSIERSDLDGKNRMIVISDNLYEPLGLTIDHMSRKLYWSDDEEGIHFKIESSTLEGQNRTTLFHGKHQQPVDIAVDKWNVYWTDWIHRAVWWMPKEAKEGNFPKKFVSYYETQQEDPTTIITRDNTGSGIDCRTYRSITGAKASTTASATSTMTATTPLVVVESYNNLTTSTEENDLHNEKTLNCLNGGKLSRVDNLCVCRPG